MFILSLQHFSEAQSFSPLWFFIGIELPSWKTFKFLSQPEGLLLTWEFWHSTCLAHLSHSAEVVDQSWLIEFADEVSETHFGLIISSPIWRCLPARILSVSASLLLCIARVLCFSLVRKMFVKRRLCRYIYCQSSRILIIGMN